MKNFRIAALTHSSMTPLERSVGRFMRAPEHPENEDKETQSDIDLEAAQAEISSELFGQGDEEEKVETAEGEGDKSSDGDETTADATKPPPQQETEEGGDKTAEAEENSEEVQAVGAPKTWTKEAVTAWAAIPDGPEKQRIEQEIAKREEDFLNGITQYKGMAEKGQAYENVVAPYMPILAAENVDPVQMFQSFASNHYLLSRGTDAQKVDIAAALFKGYKIPLVDFLNHFAETGGEQQAEDPVISSLRKEIAELKTGFSTAQQRDSDAVIAQRRQEVDAFAADPAHPYFDELANDITKLFEAGLAKDLPDAYERAVYSNPVTRQKEIDRLTAENTSKIDADKEKRKTKVASSTADQIRTTPKSRDGTVPTGSMDDTLNETLAAINSRG